MDFVTTAQTAALRAGAFLKDHLSEPREITFKGAIDLVTEMDKHAEKIVVDTLLASFPGHGILAEESARIESGSAYQWIIDPLDGTTNYAHRYPVFCVSIGLTQAGAVIAGVVYDPVRDELFSAEKGKGARMNGKPIMVSGCTLLDKSLLATGFPYDVRTSLEDNLDYFATMVKASQGMRRSGSAALDLCSVAAGRLDGYWELKLKPWDVAAGSLIVQEAGGQVSDFSGLRFSVFDTEIVASNRHIHAEMLDVLKAAQKNDTGRASV